MIHNVDNLLDLRATVLSIGLSLSISPYLYVSLALVTGRINTLATHSKLSLITHSPVVAPSYRNTLCRSVALSRCQLATYANCQAEMPARNHLKKEKQYTIKK